VIATATVRDLTITLAGAARVLDRVTLRTFTPDELAHLIALADEATAQLTQPKNR